MDSDAPLGYNRVENQLVQREVKADAVRDIYACYRTLRDVQESKAELDATSYCSKARAGGATHGGGKPFSRGALYTVLENPACIGKVRHN